MARGPQLGIRAERDDIDLEVVEDAERDRTLLGGLRTGTRSGLYFLACLGALIAFAALFYSIDQRLNEALHKMQRSLAIDELANTVERGTSSLQGQQRNFLLTRDTTIADRFFADLADVSTALDELFTLPEARALSQDITTIRDGLVQYDQQFQSFVETERQIGGAQGGGLSAQLRTTSADLRSLFRETGNGNLVNQIQRIDQQGEETVMSGSKSGVEEIRQRYAALSAFLDAAQLTETLRSRAAELLRTHETQMLSIINARFDLVAERQRFEDLFEYFEPSLRNMSEFTDLLRIESAAELRNTHLFARYTAAGGMLAIMLWLLFFGLLMLRSFSSPIQRITDAVERLTRGAAHVTIPAQGNKDDFGRLARMLDGWADTIIETDQMRAELERLHLQLDQANRQTDDLDQKARAADQRLREADERLREADVRMREADETLRLAEIKAAKMSHAPGQAEGEASYEEPAVEASYSPPARIYAPPPAPPEGGGSGPIRSVSEQLQNFTEYVTAAANDVERTETLIRGIDEMSALVGDIGDLVITIRDQTNLLAFRNPGREAVRENTRENNTLVSFDRDGQSYDAERAFAKRFDTLREATDRTEQTVHRIRITLGDVTDIAREIAETASHQALDATHRLLSQSEYLQSMLDDILNKIQPARPGQLSDNRHVRRVNEDDPFA